MSTSKTDHHDSHRAIIRSTSVISLGTLFSRILGFFRDVILAKLLGTGFAADAFFVAMKIPNLFRDLLGEGATNAAVIPVLAEYSHEKDKRPFWEFVSVVFVIALILLSAITVAGIVLSPWIVRVIVPGFLAEPHKYTLTVELTKLMFPYLLFIGLTAYAMGILYSFRSFFVPAFSPCLLNVAMIAGAYCVMGSEEPVFGLAVSVLIGGILQLLVQWWPLVKVGFKFIPPKTLRHEGAAKIGKLLLPRVAGSGVYQLTVFVDSLCASISSVVGPGGISAIYYSNRIIQFPMGIFSVALASVLLPTMSGLAHKKDIESFKKTLVFSIETIFFIMCPSTVVLLFLSNPIIRVLFQRGEFDLYSTGITSWALSFYAIGLFSFGGIKILVTAFHSLQDTKTPVKIAALCLLLNGILNVVLMFPLKVGGIALASSIAGSIDFLVLLYILEKRLNGLNSDLLGYFFKVTFAAVLTGLFEYSSWNFMNFSNELVKVMVVGGLGFVFYEFACLGLQVPQAWKIWHWAKAFVQGRPLDGT